MTEIHPSVGHDRVFISMCVPDRQPDADDPYGQPSFPALFELHHALEEIISAAVKDGTAIRPGLVAEVLAPKAARSGMSETELARVILEAAARAGIPIRNGA